MILSQVAGAYAGFFIVTVVLLGLLVGSFLNVVIHRLPIMMERGWRKECCEFLELEAPTTEERYDLIKPNSHCPQCKTPIKPWQNIPIISYALLGGRCGQCRTKISPRYPIIELVTGILSGFAAWHFGYGLALAGALLSPGTGIYPLLLIMLATSAASILCMLYVLKVDRVMRDR